MPKLIVLREGDKGDAEALCALIFSSSPVLLSYLFKGQESAFNYISQASQLPDGQYSSLRHQVACDDTKAVGCITLWNNELPPLFHENTLRSLTQFLLPNQIAHLLAANNLISEVFMAPLEHQLCLGHLAVLEQYKGLGIGKKLVSFAISRGKSLNKSQLVLDVDSRNEEAISFYSGLGFRCTKTSQFSPTKQTFFRMQYNLLKAN